MNKAYKYRIYPTKEQQTLLAKTFGCCRFVYNQALNWRVAAYRADGTSISYVDTAKAITQMKNNPDTAWLKEVDSVALQQALRNLDAAFKNFWNNKNTGFPKYKSKHRSRRSYTIPVTNHNVMVFDMAVKLPKLGYVKTEIHRAAPSDWKLKSATVSQDSDGRYYASILYEYEKAIRPIEADPAKVLGLDYKSDGLYVDSNGDCAEMPHYYRKSQKRLAKAQRILSRRKGSKKGESKSYNWEKQRLKVNRIYTRVKNQRKDFLQKRSAEIANQYDLVAVEDLSLKEISARHKDRHQKLRLGRATNDNGYGMFVNMLTYKLADRGKWLVKVDKFYPSSQLCQCGYRNPITKDLSIRTITCPVCGRTYDRDINAAINLKKEGYRLYKSA